MINKSNDIIIIGVVKMKKEIISILICSTMLLSLCGCGKKKNEIEEETVKEPEKQLKIVNLNSKTRPYAVMINNNHAAWPQAGLQDAYMVALYKDADTAKIGSIRSSRHYFLDYALENDAIYVHFGWSPQAQRDISSLKINNINGLYDTCFWRDKTLKRAYEHTAFTNIEKLNNIEQKQIKIDF